MKIEKKRVFKCNVGSLLVLVVFIKENGRVKERNESHDRRQSENFSHHAPAASVTEAVELSTALLLATKVTAHTGNCALSVALRSSHHKQQTANSKRVCVLVQRVLCMHYCASFFLRR